MRRVSPYLFVATLLVASPALADLRVWQDNVPVDPHATPPSPEDEEAEETTTTTTTTTTNPDGTTSTTTTTTTARTTHAAAAPHEHRPFLDDYRWIDITGFVQPGYIQRLDNPAENVMGGAVAGVTDDAFWLQRARFGFHAQLFDWLRVRFEMETQTTPFLTDAFIDLVPIQEFQIRVGQQLYPFLGQYQYREINQSFLDRPLYLPIAPDRTYIPYFAGTGRDIGIQISGRIGDLSPSAMLPVFRYQVGMFNGAGPNVALNSDGVFMYVGRLTLNILGLPVGWERQNDLAHNHIPRPSIALAGYSNCDTNGNWNRGFTTDIDFRWEGLFVEGSFVWMRNGASGTANPISSTATTIQIQGQHDAFFLANSNQCAGTSNGSTSPTSDPMQVTPNTFDTVSRGAHLQIQYVLPRVLTDIPFSLMDLELLFRADWVDANSPFTSGDPLFGGGPGSPGYVQPTSYTDGLNPPTRWRLTFGLNFYPTGESQIRLGINYQLNRESENVTTGGATFQSISNDVFWLQLTAGL